MAKGVYDVGAAFVSMLEYEAAQYGAPSSRSAASRPRRCVPCAPQGRPQAPHVRVWTCEACGAILDRDVNAAVTIAKAAGLAVSACAAQVRPDHARAQRDEAGTHPKRPTQPAWEQAGLPDRSGPGGCRCFAVTIRDAATGTGCTSSAAPLMWKLSEASPPGQWARRLRRPAWTFST
ncbi:zinc ribbon domain-containing protein [Salinactinospora qingdaonensis]